MTMPNPPDPMGEILRLVSHRMIKPGEKALTIAEARAKLEEYVKGEKWIWMPHAGHFILGDKCKFHLTTYLPNGYIVSTIGELWPERSSREIHAKIYDPKWHTENHHLLGDNYDAAYFKRFGYEEIGLQATYETMVFAAEKVPEDDKYQCCPYRMANAEDLYCGRYNDATSAYKGHMAACQKWAIAHHQERKKEL